MNVVCPQCGREFPLEQESGLVRCPHCSARLRAEAFGDTRAIEVSAPTAERHTRRTSELKAVEPWPEPAAGSDAPAQAHPPEFAGYAILDELGRGGMGVVYKARDPELDRVVALKVLLAAEHASPGDVERFFREAVSVAKLQHPNIVPIYEMKRHENRPYFTMDYVEGKPLGQLIRERRPGLRRALEIVEKVARALHHAHGRGVIHRDLKPANIIVNEDGEPMVTDFGLAKLMVEEGRKAGELTKTGLAIGTPHYMAPEQAAGRSKEADERTDVYSLGCVLYELLSGHPPFHGASTLEVLKRHIEQVPEPPSGRGARLPDEVVTICMKCLEKEPARRYRSAGFLAEDIRHYLNGEPIAARRASPLYLLRRQFSRNRTALVVAAAAAVLLAASVVMHIRSLQRERNSALRQLYYASIALAQSKAQEANIGQVDAILSGCTAELRGWEWGRVKREAHQELWSTPPLARAPEFPVFAPDGKTVSAAVDGSLLTFDSVTGGWLGPASPLTSPTGPGVVSPDGKIMAQRGERGRIYLFETRSGKRLPDIQAHDGLASALAFGPGNILASAGADRTIKVWKTSGEIVTAALPQSRAVSALAFSPDGKLLASGDVSGGIRLWTVRPGRELKEPGLLDRHSADISRLAFSPDRKHLASASVDRTVRVWDVAAEEQLLCLRGHSDAVDGLAYSRDGARLVSSGADRTLKIWDALRDRTSIELSPDAGPLDAAIFDPAGARVFLGGASGLSVWDAADGKLLHRWPEPVSARPLALSPDGHTLTSATGGGKVRLRNAESGKIDRELIYSEEGEVLALAYSPSGRRLAAAGTGGTVKVWDTSDWRELPRPAGHRGAVRALAYSRCGSYLASAGEDRLVSVWDAETGRLVHRFTGPDDPQGTPWTVAFSPDSRTVASAFLNHIVLFDMTSGRERLTLTGHAVRVYALAFSPDGRRLASASKDETVRLWDAENGRELLKLEGHSGWVSGVAFGPQGRKLVSCSRDGTGRIWLAEPWAGQ